MCFGGESAAPLTVRWPFVACLAGSAYAVFPQTRTTVAHNTAFALGRAG